MPLRDHILDAALRVYAEHGFRGATTRRIADAAGVNEVTLFRIFGSKATLITAALQHTGMADAASPHALPALPRDPEHELTTWASGHLDQLRERRMLIRQALSDFDARPDAARAAQGWDAAASELHRYLERLGALGFVAWDAHDTTELVLHGGTRTATGLSESRREDVHAAAAMFLAALFSDAMGRDMMPQLYPQPAERAPALYVRLFLRALACAGPATVRGRRSPRGAPSSTEAA